MDDTQACSSTSEDDKGPLLKKIKTENEESEDCDSSFPEHLSEDCVKIESEEIFIKEEHVEYQHDVESQANLETDDNYIARSKEIEEILAKLGPQKHVLTGTKIDTTDEQVFQFIITLLRGSAAPKIWRRFQVPASYNFNEFHLAIQKVMGWKSVEFDYHLHLFRVVNPDTLYEDHIAMSLDLDTYDEAKDENKTKIRDYFKCINQKATYEYDFGMGWEHEIVFEKALMPEKGAKYPKCLEGEKACPPEDGTLSSDEEYNSDEFDAESCF